MIGKIFLDTDGKGSGFLRDSIDAAFRCADRSVVILSCLLFESYRGRGWLGVAIQHNETRNVHT